MNLQGNILKVLEIREGMMVIAKRNAVLLHTSDGT